MVLGTAVGLLGALVVAGFAQAIADAASGVGQELFNAGVLFTAVAMLGWHNVWMQRHGRELASRLNDVGREVIAGRRPLYAVTVVVALSVLREGSEVVLFLHGIASAGGGNATTMLLGGLSGVAAGAAVGAALYLGLLTIPTKHLFTVTSWLILLLAAGMASQGAAFLVQADILPSLGHGVWDTSAILSERGVIGQVLHTLAGYTARPSGIQVVFYCATILVLGGLTSLTNPRSPREHERAVAVAWLLAAVGVFAGVGPAEAQPKVFSPIIVPGEIEIETRGIVTHDSNPAKDDERKLKIGIGTSLTDWWYIELEGEWEKGAQGHTEFEASALENIFQLLDQGRYWLDAGLLVEYEQAAASAGADKIEYGALLQKEVGPTINTANLVFENKIGNNGSGSTEFEYAWQTRWRCRREFTPGFEAFGKLGEVGNILPSSQQEHMIGPAIFGDIKLGARSKIKYELGYLIGLTGETPDGSVRWLLEYEFVP